MCSAETDPKPDDRRGKLRQTLKAFVSAWLVFIAISLAIPMWAAAGGTGVRASFLDCILATATRAIFRLAGVSLDGLAPPQSFLGYVAWLFLGLALASSLPAVVWVAIRPVRRKVVKIGLPLALIGFLAYCPSWRAREYQTHRMFHSNPCKQNLRSLHYGIAEELGAPNDSPTFSLVQDALVRDDGAAFFSAAKKVLLENPELAVCPETGTEPDDALLQSLRSATNLDELAQVLGYHLNRTVTSPDDPLLWDRPQNHRYCDRSNVLYADGEAQTTDQEAFSKRYPDCAAEPRGTRE